MSAAAKTGAERAAVENFLRSNRHLALFISHFAYNKADNASFNLARDTCNIIAVVFRCPGIAHHFARHRCCNDFPVKEVFQSRKYAALKRHSRP